MVKTQRSWLLVSGGTTVDPQTQADVLHRLHCVEGHVRGIIRMVEDNRPYLAIVQQSQAVQGALRQINALLVAEYLDICLKTACANNHNKEAAYRQLRDELLALWAEKDYRRR